MIPVRLRLQNFLSYHEPVDLDLSALHLACISGQNGAGKSSLLDAITWALFGKARRVDDAVIHAGAESAEVILDFEYEEQLYRVQRRKQRGRTGTLDLFLYSSSEDGQVSWKSFNEKSMTQTEERIARILRMDYETFINASFFLQGQADQFAQKTAAERKRILGSILGLDEWDNYARKAAEKRKLLEDTQRQTDSRLAEIDAELAEEQALRSRLADLEQQLAQAVTASAEHEQLLRTIRTHHELQRHAREQLEEARRELDGFQERAQLSADQLAARRAEREALTRSLAREAEITTAFQEWQELRSQLDALDRIAADYYSLQEQRTEPKLAIEKAGAILTTEGEHLRSRAAAAERLETEIPAKQNEGLRLQTEIAGLETRLSGLKALEAAKKDLLDQREDLLAENKRLRQEMNALHDRKERLESDAEPRCPVCGQDLTPAHRIEVVQGILSEGKSLGDAYRDNQSRIEALNTDLQGLEEQMRDLAAADSMRQAKLRTFESLQTWLSEREPELRTWQEQGQPRLAEIEQLLAAGRFAEGDREKLARIEAQASRLGFDPLQHAALRAHEAERRSAEQELRLLERQRSAIGPLDRQLADLEQRAEADRQEVVRKGASVRSLEASFEEQFRQLPDLDGAEQKSRELLDQAARLREDTAGARQRVEDLAKRRDRRKELAHQREQTGAAIGRYRQLERTFGKDGVPALLIEQALPDIEAEANDLLDRLSGGEMSVRLLTQRDYKDKSREGKRETLDIQISAVNSGTREYESFSGGEAFRVNFALRIALSRILAQRAGAKLQTLIIDEGFGSQDAFGRQRLVEAINLVQDDFARILVITHLEELKDHFPSRIEVEKTESGSRVSILTRE